MLSLRLLVHPSLLLKVTQSRYFLLHPQLAVPHVHQFYFVTKLYWCCHLLKPYRTTSAVCHNSCTFLTALLLFLPYDHLLLMAIPVAVVSLSSVSKGISIICSNACSIGFISVSHVILLFLSVNVSLSRNLKIFTKHSEDWEKLVHKFLFWWDGFVLAFVCKRTSRSCASEPMIWYHFYSSKLVSFETKQAMLRLGCTMTLLSVLWWRLFWYPWLWSLSASYFYKAFWHCGLCTVQSI